MQIKRERRVGVWSKRRQTKTAKVKTAIRDPFILLYNIIFIMLICIVSSNQYPTAAERAGRGGLSAVAPAGDVAAVDCVTGQ